jgi:energy-coupling factor transporter transmembrane protein EcfT
MIHGDTEEKKSTARATFYSVSAIVSTTLLSLFLGEQPIPFYSAAFVFGTSSVFFFAITYGTTLAISQSGGVLTLLLLLNISAETPTPIIVIQGIFLSIFFLILSILPNISPYVLKKESHQLKTEVEKLTKKVSELTEINKNEHRDSVEQKSTENKQLASRMSSRNTLLITYARGLLQSGSVREIVNLLFYNLSKAFTPKQCLMLIKTPGKDELIISRIIHNNHEKLENSKIVNFCPSLQTVLKNKKILKLPSRSPLTEEIDSELLIPVLLEDEVHAIFSICDIKEGNLTENDLEFIKVLAGLTSGAAEQITVVTSRQS